MLENPHTFLMKTGSKIICKNSFAAADGACFIVPYAAAFVMPEECLPCAHIRGVN